MIYNLCQAKGKYIALCEGDDYWTDPLKLQKQVDFLEKNEDYSICFHKMKTWDENKKLFITHLNQIIPPPDTSTIELLASMNYMHTPSVIFRKNFNELPLFFQESPVGDYVLHILNAQYGKIKYLNTEMGVYRKHTNGIWSCINDIEKYTKWIHVLNLLLKNINFSSNIREILEKQLFESFKLMIHCYENENDFDTIHKISTENPTLLLKFNLELLQELENMKTNSDIVLQRVKMITLIKATIKSIKKAFINKFI